MMHILVGSFTAYMPTSSIIPHIGYRQSDPTHFSSGSSTGRITQEDVLHVQNPC